MLEGRIRSASPRVRPLARLRDAAAAVRRPVRAGLCMCGALLILMGLMLMTGLDSRFPLLLSSAAADTLQGAEPTAETGEQALGSAQRNPAPDFTCYDGAGNAVALGDMRGKPVIVNFFASWCGPCRMEMPYFDECYAAYGDQVTFMMVDLCAFGNDTPEDGRQMVADGGWTFPVYFDTDGDAMLRYVIRSMPTTIFVSADGQLKGRHTGMMDKETLEKTVRRMIGEE